ncbi:hypothetical protein CEY12_04480 [Chryseobacterium sp. T16E-39]|uniref:hypothetical protein n=1 Tax=Chryseobacterium sp. T16E-39 TaxID=2015076 RepID=UPI000B5B3A21|nr:hypothetical protein [Chryseobacterium sp. T16E-39]ASK29400.1 hypothetical protein CEY12_04480 [Chryseobacterium sp. T16E-39]
MQTLMFSPFSKDKFIEDLRRIFPQYKIQTSFGTLQVRTSGFTITGNVKINADPETGMVSTQTNSDIAMIYFIFNFPMAIYIRMKKDKIKRLEDEVVAGIKTILNPHHQD